MDAILYNKVEVEANRIIECIGVSKTNLGAYAASLANRWAYSIFPDNLEFEVDCEDVLHYNAYGVKTTPSADKMFYDARGLKSVTIKNLYTGTATSMAEAFGKSGSYGSYANILESVSFEGKTIIPTSTRLMFSGRSSLKTVDAVFDLSEIAAYSYGYNFSSMFKECSLLEEVRFVPNTILWMNYQIFNVSQNLSDDSLVSIANGLLKDASEYNTVTFLSTPKARCSTLMGTVSEDLFTKDDNGTTSLADFITNTKGWTLG